MKKKNIFYVSLSIVFSKKKEKNTKTFLKSTRAILFNFPFRCQEDMQRQQQTSNETRLITHIQ